MRGTSSPLAWAGFYQGGPARLAEMDEAPRREVPRSPEAHGEQLLRGVGWFQGTAKLLAGGFLRTYFSMEVAGADRVPVEGPIVLTPNHDSMWDVPLLVVACPRRIVFMATQGVFDQRHKAAFFGALGGFPVERGTRDLGAMKKALAVVRARKVLCMYPEGTRSFGEGLLPFLPGAAWVALAEGAPVVPVGIRGTGEIWPKGGRGPRRARVRIAFGEPIEVERERAPNARRAKAAELTQELRSRVEALRD